MKLRELVGSGDRIGLFVLPFLATGLAVNLLRPAWFTVGGPPRGLAALSIAILCIGVIVWLWSVVLILTRVPRHELITSGPYAIVRHPLYTGVSLLVLPWLGFLADTWLGAAVGVAMYFASRKFAPEEERQLSQAFGAQWDEYRRHVLLPWL